jgi:RNA polymerase sigma-70 factor, ECF subfamily
MKVDIKQNFEIIYKKESDAIFRFCLIRVSDREQAIDITQETFLRLWQNLIDNKEIRNSRAFLFTIAHHLVIDWYRKKKSISFKDMKNADDEDEENTDYDPSNNITSDNVLLGVEGRYLLDKINELTETNRLPVYLRFVEDLSPEEIGNILKISANAVSVRINRGLLELREKTAYNSEEVK